MVTVFITLSRFIYSKVDSHQVCNFLMLGELAKIGPAKTGQTRPLPLALLTKH